VFHCFDCFLKTIKRASSATKHAVLPNLESRHSQVATRKSQACKACKVVTPVTRKSPAAKAVIKTKWTLLVEIGKYYLSTGSGRRAVANSIVLRRKYQSC
jgi:hypothetical protein